jgi:hypothetical protein
MELSLGKPKGKNPLGRSRRRRRGIKIYVGDID